MLVHLASQFCLQPLVHVLFQLPVQPVLMAEAVQLLLTGQSLTE
jgi:hypothetical protein